MRIALYKGKSWESRAIEWLTRSPYSHAAFLFDEPAALAARAIGRNVTAGNVVEAWTSGVRLTESLSSQHTPGTLVDLFSFAAPLSADEEKRLASLVLSDLGRPYYFLGVLRFVTRRPGKLGRRLFCSELVSQRCQDIGRPLFRDTESWRVPPDWISRTIALRAAESIITK